MEFMNQYHKDETKNLDNIGRKFSLRKSHDSNFDFSESSLQEQMLLRSHFKSTLYESKLSGAVPLNSIQGFNRNNFDHKLLRKKDCKENQYNLNQK